MRVDEVALVFALGLVALGCEEGGGAPKPGADPAKPMGAASASAATAPAPAAAAGPDGDAKPAVAAEKGYPLDAIKAVADNCSSPWVILTSAPTKNGEPKWAISRQTLLANQQFRLVTELTAPGQVQIAAHEIDDDSAALVATCNDGGTCNQLAAMYKAVVRSSKPRLGCGPVPGMKKKTKVMDWAMGKDGVPASDDVIAQCARLNACMIATDRSTAGDPFLECQKGPSKFKLKCAQKYPCAEVLACVGE